MTDADRTAPEQAAARAAEPADVVAPARVVSVLMIVAGLAIAGFTLAPWGITHEGVQPSVTGLGGVRVPGATAEDVAFLTDHTQRPGMVLLAIGAVTIVLAALATWRPTLRLAAAGWSIIAGLVTIGWSIAVLSAPEHRLFDNQVTDTLDAGPSVLQPGWGLLAEIVTGAVLVGLGGIQVALLWLARGRGGASAPEHSRA